MREIKFRGKNIKRSCWVYGDCMQHNDGDILIGVHSKHWTDDGYSYPYYAEVRCVNEETVGQYTGLKDKNGKEIYEGDILVWEHKGVKSNPLVVDFRHGSFGYYYTDNNFYSFAGNSNFTFNPFDTDIRFEIIGNIHDNPEFIKNKKAKLIELFNYTNECDK